MKIVVVGVHEVNAHFSKLLERVEAGDEVIVTSLDKPVARIVPYTAAASERKPGALAGQITIKPGFDDLPTGFDVFAG